MTKSAYVLLALVCVLVVVSGGLTYLWIDRSISLGYARQSAETANNAIRRLERLLEEEWRGMPEAEVLRRLQIASDRMPGAKAVVKKEDGVIWIDEVRFNIDRGRLTSIGSQ